MKSKGKTQIFRYRLKWSWHESLGKQFFSVYNFVSDFCFSAGFLKYSNINQAFWNKIFKKNYEIRLLFFLIITWARLSWKRILRNFVSYICCKVITKFNKSFITILWIIHTYSTQNDLNNTIKILMNLFLNQ